MIKGICFLVFALAAGASFGGSLSLQQEVALPAGTAEGGQYRLNGVVGEPAVGTSNGSDITVHAGFHAPEGVDGPPEEGIFTDGFE